ncbi:MAG: tetratricopeptide repeat protein [Caldilineaceae bacterium]
MSLQKRLKNAQMSNFVGREEQLDIFRRNITSRIPEYPFVLIAGQGGVGKSTLLEHFRAVCEKHSVLHASTDYPDRTPISVMSRLIENLKRAGYQLNSFQERYQRYLYLEEKIQQEDDKPTTFGNILGQLTEISNSYRFAQNSTKYSLLRSALANLYSDEPSMRRIVSDTGLDLSHIVLSPNISAINNWHSILLEIEKVGRIDDLLKVVEREYGSSNSEFRDACVMYRHKVIETDRADMDWIGKDIFAQKGTSLSDYLSQKLEAKDDVQLFLNPLVELTPLFIESLNEIAMDRQLVLMFDTVEETKEKLLPWLMALFNGQYGEISEYTSFVFAGRSFNHHDWLLIEPLSIYCDLEPFTLEETSLYLRRHGIDDSSEVDNIFHVTGGLPVHVAMLAMAGQPSGGKMTRTVVDRFLSSVPNSVQRQVALQLSLTRKFNLDILVLLFSSEVDAQQGEDIFSWLIELPFVQNSPESWSYHPIVRAQMVTYQRSQSPTRFAKIHQQLAEYYFSLAEQAGQFSKKKWQDRQWWSYYVEATYHFLCASPYENLSEIQKNIADIILNIDSEMMTSWVSALNQAAIDLGDFDPALQLASLIEAGISAIKTYKLNEAFQLFDTFELLIKEPYNLDFGEGNDAQQTPVGWIGSGGSYQIGFDSQITYSGKPTIYLKSNAERNESGKLLQIIKAESYLGKRVRFSGYVKSQKVREWAGLWMRVDGQSSIRLSFDNMLDRPIIGTTNWQKCEIVLDIPKESSRIVYGVWLQGQGHLWMADFMFEVVGQETPLTGIENKYDPENLDFAQSVIGSEQLPIGWLRAGSNPQDYIMGVDRSTTYQGKISACLRSRTKDAKRFGTLMQSFQADKYIGQRLQMSAYVKSKEIEDWAGLWMRVDGVNSKRSLHFDNMQERPITGTTEWQNYQIILDIPEGATAIAFGALMGGSGQIWVNNFRFEQVSHDIPSTEQVRVGPTNPDFEESINGKSPSGWILAGNKPEDYSIGTDSNEAYKGSASGFLKSKVEKIDGFGTLMQSFRADLYVTQRLRMTAYAKSEAVEDWAGLWMRVDGPKPNKSLSFDNMQGRPIKGTTEWQEYQIVLEVPIESVNIAFGILLSGTGQVWVDDFRFEAVNQDIAVTSRPEDLIAEYSEAIKYEPNDASIFCRRAGVYAEIKNYEKAIDDYTQALHLSPDYADAYSRRGLVYLIQGKLELSIFDYTQSLRVNPQNPSAYYNLACAYALQKNLKASLQTLRYCLELGDCKRYLKLISNDSDFDYIRNDPRFHALLIEFSESS